MCDDTTSADECRVVDMDALTYRRCRAVDPRGQFFYLRGCSAGQVINIQSALLGFSQTYQPDVNPPRCPYRNCTVSVTDVPAINKCNGRQRCSITQGILLFPTSQLCDLQKDGNFIEIKYTCVTGMTFRRFCILLNIYISYVVCSVMYCDNYYKSVSRKHSYYFKRCIQILAIAHCSILYGDGRAPQPPR